MTTQYQLDDFFATLDENNKKPKLWAPAAIVNVANCGLEITEACVFTYQDSFVFESMSLCS